MLKMDAVVGNPDHVNITYVKYFRTGPAVDSLINILTPIDLLQNSARLVMQSSKFLVDLFQKLKSEYPGFGGVFSLVFLR